MPGSFSVDIVTPERVILSERAVSLVAPGVLGSFGILVNHSPMLSELAPGELRIRKENGEELDMAVGGGFLQVFDNKVTLLADSAELVANIDVDRARRSLQTARDDLKAAQATYNQTAIDQAERAVARAENRIRLGG